jgi:hypothetical protein
LSEFIWFDNVLTTTTTTTTQYSEVLDYEVEMKLEVFSFNNLGTDKLIGECSLGIPQRLPPETVVDRWVDLIVKPSKPSGKKEVRFLFFTYRYYHIPCDSSYSFFLFSFIKTLGCQCSCRKYTRSHVLFLFEGF